MQVQARRAPQRLQQRIVRRRRRHQRGLVAETGRRQRRVTARPTQADAGVHFVAGDVADHQQVHAPVLTHTSSKAELLAIVFRY